MGKLKTKRELEATYFQLFAEAYNLPEGKIRYGDKPDVIIRGYNKLGIEITNFYHTNGNLPACEQKQRIKRTQTIKLAHKLYLEQIKKNHNLSFAFSKNYPIKNPEQLAAGIAACCAQVTLPRKGWVAKTFFNAIPELESIYFDDREYAKPRWRINQVSQVPLMSLASLKKIILSKEQKSREYRSCDAFWLLIIVDTVDPAQEQDIGIDGLETISSSVFKKIIIFKTHSNDIIEMKSQITGQ